MSHFASSFLQEKMISYTTGSKYPPENFNSSTTELDFGFMRIFQVCFSLLPSIFTTVMFKCFSIKSSSSRETVIMII